MNTPSKISSTITLLIERISCSEQTVGWVSQKLGQLAVFLLVGNEVDRMAFKGDGGTEESRSQKEGFIKSLLAAAFDMGWQGDADAVAFSLEQSRTGLFKTASAGAEAKELLLATGIELDEIEQILAESESRDKFIHEVKLNSAKDNASEIKARVEADVRDAKNEYCYEGGFNFMDRTPIWFGLMVARRVESALMQRRSWLVRDIAKRKMRGQNPTSMVSDLTIVNGCGVKELQSAIAGAESMQAGHGTFNDNPMADDVGRIGDNEQVDITY